MTTNWMLFIERVAAAIGHPKKMTRQPPHTQWQWGMRSFRGTQLGYHLRLGHLDWLRPSDRPIRKENVRTTVVRSE
jgi:hypothetical protein